MGDDIAELDPAEATEAAQKRAEDAFSRASQYQFQGKPLFAYSIERETAAQRLGLQYGTVDLSKIRKRRINVAAESETHASKARKRGKRPVKKTPQPFFTVIDYPGILDDIILVLYLCTLDVDECFAIRGDEAEREAWKDAYQWAEKVGIRNFSEAHGEAYVIFSEIMADVAATKTRVSGHRDGNLKESSGGN